MEVTPECLQMRKDIGEEIISWLKKNKYTQEKLADDLHISKSGLRHKLRAEYKEWFSEDHIEFINKLIPTITWSRLYSAMTGRCEKTIITQEQLIFKLPPATIRELCNIVNNGKDEDIGVIISNIHYVSSSVDERESKALKKNQIMRL